MDGPLPFPPRSELGKAAVFQLWDGNGDLAVYGGRAGCALTKGNPGGNEPTGNLTADNSPVLSFSAASRNAATNMEYANQKVSRTSFATTWKSGAGDLFVWFGRVCGL